MKEHHMPNKTALVTGASSGIGAILASKLAREGHDVVLVARNVDKLTTLSRELAARYGVSATAIVADLAEPSAAESVFEQVAAQGSTVDILVNNAGFGSAGPFLDTSLAEELEMIQVNIRSLLALSHLFARGMRERGFGRILNIASTAGFQPGPYMATYYATKAFVISFSLALAYELRGTGVSVTCHCPGATHTAFAERAGIRQTKLFQRPGVASAEDVATHAYRAMMAGKKLAVHGALNRVVADLGRRGSESTHAERRSSGAAALLIGPRGRPSAANAAPLRLPSAVTVVVREPHVLRRDLAVENLVCFRQRLLDLAWDTQDEAARGNPCACRDEAPRRDHAALTDDGAVEDDGPHAHQHAILNLAAVNRRAVAHHHVGSDERRIAIPHVDHAAVLQVAVRPELDAIEVTPEHAAVPDARALEDLHVTHDRGPGRHEAAFREAGHMFEVTLDDGSRETRAEGLERGVELSRVSGRRGHPLH
jgi:short-subunit dehydrogenase